MTDFVNAPLMHVTEWMDPLKPPTLLPLPLYSEWHDNRREEQEAESSDPDFEYDAQDAAFPIITADGK